MNTTTPINPTSGKATVQLILIGLMLWLCATQVSSLLGQSLFDLSFHIEMKPLLRFVLDCILPLAFFLLFIVFAINLYAKQKSTEDKNKSFLTILIVIFVIVYAFVFITTMYLHPVYTDVNMEIVFEYYDVLGESFIDEIWGVLHYLLRIGVFILIIYMSEKKLRAAA
ncbi:MAG: hypothetical protein IPM74_06095 [Crocinitomicaceae bacterium]|nr:hypothetical protein [Crocinitomicaceae bacterium]MBK8925475.1 hypothetical protein [Crocinitomicaceae bacterium]